MNQLLGLLIARILVGAAWVVVHVALLVRAGGAREEKAWVRWLALVPPFAPLVGLRLEARVLSYAWCVLSAAYIALWYAS